MMYLQAKATLATPIAKPSFFNLAVEAVVMLVTAYALLQLFS